MQVCHFVLFFSVCVGWVGLKVDDRTSWVCPTFAKTNKNMRPMVGIIYAVPTVGIIISTVEGYSYDGACVV